MKQSDSFLQPVISLLGLSISLITSILPIFKEKTITNLFISPEFSQIVSYLAFVLSIVLIWQIIQFHPFININIGQLKNRGAGYLQPLYSINQNKLIWILIIIAVIFSFSFLYMKIIRIPLEFFQLAALIQSFIYLMFFLVLTSIFAILFSSTKNMYNFQDQQEKFPYTVAETLSRYNIVKTGVEIIENKMVDNTILDAHGLLGIGIARQLKIKTPNQKEEEIQVIMDNNGKQVLKVLSKRS